MVILKCFFKVLDVLRENPCMFLAIILHRVKHCSKREKMMVLSATLILYISIFATTEAIQNIYQDCAFTFVFMRLRRHGKKKMTSQ